MHTHISSATALQEVILNICGMLALPGEIIVFSCVRKNSTLLEWQSADYVGRGGNDIQISSAGDRDNVSSLTDRNTYATRDSVTEENGVIVIVSQLFITASEQFPTSSVTCRIDGRGPQETIFFNTTGTEFHSLRQRKEPVFRF